MEVVTENGTLSDNLEDVLSKWETSFTKLYTSKGISNSSNTVITRNESKHK